MQAAVERFGLAGEPLHCARAGGQLLVVGGFVVVVCLGFWWVFSRARKLRAWARRHGLKYRWWPGDRPGYRGLSAFCKREEASISNLMYGPYEGHVIAGFDFCSVRKMALKLFRDRESQKWPSARGSAVFLKMEAPLKRLHVAPEGLAAKLKSSLGGKDINFESAEFNKAFVVKAESDKWAFAVITPRVMGLLLTHPTFHVEFDYGGIIAYGLRNFEPEEFGHAADIVTGIRNLLPDYLLEEIKADSK